VISGERERENWVSYFRGRESIFRVKHNRRERERTRAAEIEGFLAAHASVCVGDSRFSTTEITT